MTADPKAILPEVGPTSDDLVHAPSTGRTFSCSRRVSIADASSDGRMELDAIGRFLQDAGNDDTDDAGLGSSGLTWVARRATIEVLEPARARELLSLTTWCSGTGSHWAERRSTLVGERGAHIEAAAIWVHVDPETGRPKRWDERFAERYLEASGGREVDARLRHPREPSPDHPSSSMPFRFRRTDHDAFGHVNNAAYLAVLEESLGGNDPGAPIRVEIEWRKPSEAGEELTVVEQPHETGVQKWIMFGDEVRATIAARPLG